MGEETTAWRWKLKRIYWQTARNAGGRGTVGRSGRGLCGEITSNNLPADSKKCGREGTLWRENFKRFACSQREINSDHQVTHCSRNLHAHGTFRNSRNNYKKHTVTHTDQSILLLRRDVCGPKQMISRFTINYPEISTNDNLSAKMKSCFSNSQLTDGDT